MRGLGAWSLRSLSRSGLLASASRPKPLLSPSPPTAVRGFAGASASWWAKYVDGLNPDDPQMRELSAFLRAQGVDPYAMERHELEQCRKFLAFFPFINTRHPP